jgi:predicted nuclease of predicted toxin-antitoxin system
VGELPLTSPPSRRASSYRRQPVAQGCRALGKSGSEAAHVGDVGLLTAADRTSLEDAAANDLVIVSADTDFGKMLGFADTIFGQTPGS